MLVNPVLKDFRVNLDLTVRKARLDTQEVQVQQGRQEYSPPSL